MTLRNSLLRDELSRGLTAAPLPLARRYPRAAAEDYARRGRLQIQGWLFPVDAELVLRIGDLQTRNGIAGSVGEIGVHHGMLAILLYLLLHKGERGLCIDVFDAQQKNVDGSGKGDEAIFRANLAKAGIDAGLIDFINESSDRVAPRQISSGGKPRLFSIDGGHTAELTLNDLSLVDRVLADGGVIILDDVFNKDWPGVVTGLAQFLNGDAECRPFAISTNKVFLCRPAASRLYQEGLESLARTHVLKRSSFFGEEVLIFGRRHRIFNDEPGLFRRNYQALLRRLAWYRHRLLNHREATTKGDTP